MKGLSLQMLRILYSGVMKRILLTSAMAVSICVFGSAAFAQGNSITIIHDDGSKEVIELGSSVPDVAPSPALKATPRVEVVPRAERVAPPVSSPAVPPDAAAEPKVVPVLEKEFQPKPKLEPQTKPQPKQQESVPSQRLAKEHVQVPPRKPHRQVISNGEQITKDKALYIALSEAPPARDVQVKAIETSQGNDFSVIFETDDGGYEVLVDGLSGVIKHSGAIEKGQSLVQPGHLPVR